jgi:hypothetical protein
MSSVDRRHHEHPNPCAGRDRLAREVRAQSAWHRPEMLDKSVRSIHQSTQARLFSLSSLRSEPLLRVAASRTNQPRQRIGRPFRASCSTVAIARAASMMSVSCAASAASIKAASPVVAGRGSCSSTNRVIRLRDRMRGWRRSNVATWSGENAAGVDRAGSGSTGAEAGARRRRRPARPAPRRLPMRTRPGSPPGCHSNRRDIPGRIARVSVVNRVFRGRGPGPGVWGAGGVGRHQAGAHHRLLISRIQDRSGVMVG